MNSLDVLVAAWCSTAWPLLLVFTFAVLVVAALRRPCRRAFGAEREFLLWLVPAAAMFASALPHAAASVSTLPPVILSIATSPDASASGVTLLPLRALGGCGSPSCGAPVPCLCCRWPRMRNSTAA